MPWKRKVGGGLVAVIGFILSPLSWWNDLFVNVPLALAFAWVVSLFYKPAFDPSVILGYWLTNVLGLVLMHRGIKDAVSGQPNPYSRRELLKDLAVSLAYTALIVLLIKLGVLQPFEDYFEK